MNRFHHYLERMRRRKGRPIQHPEEVSQSADPKIDQDLPGFPHGQATKEIIRPETDAEMKTADPDLSGRNRPATGGAADEERLKINEDTAAGEEGSSFPAE